MSVIEGRGNASRVAAFGAAFDAAGDEDLRQLHRAGAKVRFGRNETIFNESDEANYAYKVVSGAVRLCKHMVNGRRQIADFLLPGEFFGFLQFGSYSFSAEAVGEVVLMAYPNRQVETLSSTMPAMRERILMVLSQRLLGMQDHLVMLGRQSARERVASFLLMLAERADADDGVPLEVPMSRQDIADYLGLTIETVCRVFSDLKRMKVIATPSLHQVEIRDVGRLETLVEGDDE